LFLPQQASDEMAEGGKIFCRVVTAQPKKPDFENDRVLLT